ncbi:Kynurenine formamidase [Trichoderma simmonsii]|uniref:Kynurenine formamidase n=1 Tax=Trichoderma simmonsii TaxID=1491479 RepID=A0A8G0PGT1_9HYPO|nr:Kynurenine formamidase [Trichoderma simmonsii]
MATTDIPGLVFTSHKFGPHSLQEVGVWESGEAKSSGYWAIFIHGGAWRDRSNTFRDFIPSIKHMIQDKDKSSSIRGFMSLDYRLSDGTETPPVQHPDHIDDIAAGLSLLHEKYCLKDNYVLIGHSAGATLAFQLLMGVTSPQVTVSPPLPVAIIGISGIYDLVGINDRHDGNYAGFITSAFGSNQGDWQNASPAKFTGDFHENWPGDRLTILAHSQEDSLVDTPEADALQAKLQRCKSPVHIVGNLRGEHDFVWQDGSQIAELVFDTLLKLPRIL